MIKLIIVSSMLMVAGAYPTLQLLTSLPSEESISLTSLLQPQASASVRTTSSEESVENPEPTRETPIPSQTSSTQSEDVQPTPEPTSSTDDISSASSLTSSSLGSISVQHQLLPPETISLPITITTSPGLRTVLAPETIRIHEPTVAKVGELVQKIPTAVSHQSSTVVHKHAEVVTPIVAPAVRTITSQVVRAYHTPLVYAADAPVIKLVQH